jgi:microfibrillar-associated protein 1
MAKPLFVPKHKRNLLQDEEKKWEEEERRTEMEKRMAEKRKMESRTLVAISVAAIQEKSLLDGDMEDEGTGASNAPPNDDDDLEVEQARDAWEVRELQRLLDAMDEMKRHEKEQLERDRRRQMTDEEVLEYDKTVGRYQAPGSNRQAQGAAPTGTFMQRFYHRGAFYMDKEEFDEGDVRHKAAEYARAATGEDKIDKAALPKVMQVKGFGLARQNTKYKGLAREDTTDKRLDILPIVHKKK